MSIYFNSRQQGLPDQSLSGLWIDPILNEASTGTATLFAGLRVNTLDITSAAGTLTTAATVYIEGAPTEASTNYALYVDGGAVRVDGDFTMGGDFTVTGNLAVTGTTTLTADATAVADLIVDDQLAVGGAAVTGAKVAIEFADVQRNIVTSVGHTIHAPADSMVINDGGSDDATISQGAAIFFGIPTYTATSGTTTTLTTGATVYIEGAPVGGSEVSVTTAYALQVAAGNCAFGGIVSVTGNLTIANSSGLVIGSGSQITTSAIAELQVGGTAAADSMMSIAINSADDVPASIEFSKSRGTAIGAVDVVTDNNEIGSLRFFPADGSDNASEMGEFRCEVDDGTPATGAIGTAFVWSQHDSGSSFRETMRLDTAGLLTVAVGGISVTAGGLTVADGASTFTDNAAVTTAPLGTVHTAIGSSWHVLSLEGSPNEVGVDNDEVYITFRMRDEVAGPTAPEEMGRITHILQNAEGGAMDSQFVFTTMIADSLTTGFTFGSAGAAAAFSFGFGGSNAVRANWTATTQSVRDADAAAEDAAGNKDLIQTLVADLILHGILI